jgi:thiol-disulfide isomerase/thioredoxin
MNSFFEKFPLTKLKYPETEAWIEQPGFKILFLWGLDCPNCEIAKNVLLEYLDEILDWEKKYKVKWFHADFYENFEWAHRFGLQGIPHFIIYNNSKKVGKISPFRDALDKVFTSS